jgi:hypothetical protein
MKLTRLAAAVYREMEIEGITLSALSARITRTQGAMSQLLNGGKRASPETMKPLSRGWHTPGAGVRVMIAHLQDELHRAGWPVHDYRIEHRAAGSVAAIQSKLDADLLDLRAAAEHLPALACLISDVLDVARAELPAGLFGSRSKGITAAAAEKRADHETKKDKIVDGQ